MTEKSAALARRAYRRRPITVTEPKIVPMPEEDRAHAVAVLAAWLGELLNDGDFRARAEDQTRTNQDRDSE
ncbi:hypothetical protein GCM10009754_52920 [Amycolatopsis minnesotensis]|uniref:Uncharacterized protein n=1 Tax=Amycolatopsis minnesotensis TaxID=337894 RepID=A0ABN2RN37_9PSEU